MLQNRVEPYRNLWFYNFLMFLQYRRYFNTYFFFEAPTLKNILAYSAANETTMIVIGAKVKNVLYRYDAVSFFYNDRTINTIATSRIRRATQNRLVSLVRYVNFLMFYTNFNVAVSKHCSSFTFKDNSFNTHR